MRLIEFMFCIYENIFLYFFILFFSSIIYIFIFRKYFFSIYDPFLYSIITSSIGTVTVIFLYLIGELKTQEYFYSYILTQLAYIVGLLSVRPIQIKKRKVYKNIICDKNLLNLFFILVSSAFILTQFYLYKTVGIPLFTEKSRLILYEGIGVFKRFNDGFFIITLILSIEILMNKIYSKNIIKILYLYFIIFFLLISQILSGAKSGILFFLFLFILYAFSLTKSEEGYLLWQKSKKKSFFYLIIVLLCTLAIITFISGGITDGIFRLFSRVVAYGDVYLYSYTTDLKNIQLDTPVKNIFGNILAAYRIIPRESLKQAAGFQLFNNVYGTTGKNFGPNLRHNILGYLNFGFFGSILFSFIIGFVISYIRKIAYLRLKNNTLSRLMFILIMYFIVTINFDLLFFIDRMNNFILTFIIVYFPYYIIKGSIVKNKNLRNQKIQMEEIKWAN